MSIKEIPTGSLLNKFTGGIFMYRKDEEFGGFLGMYLEGVRQASHPMYARETEPKAQKRAEEVKPVFHAVTGIKDEQTKNAEQTNKAAA
jgi:hypothetical protein